MLRIFFAVVILLLGVILAAGGIWLAFLGGTYFYIVMGLGLAVSGGLLLARRQAGLAVYGLTLIATLAWSLFEVGFDWWALAPRGGLLTLLGLLILTPPVVRGLIPHGVHLRRYGASSAVLGLALVVCVATAVYSFFMQPHDIGGSFGEERMQASAEVDMNGVPPGEWHSYGRTVYGRRYSPLDQITPENVANLEVAWTYNTGEVRDENDPGETTYEVTPLVFDDTMYLCTPFATVIALDPVTGEEKWRFEPQLKQPPSMTTQHMTCRGVAYHDGSGAGAPEDEGEPTVGARPVEGGTGRVAESAAEVTTDAAGVVENVVTGFAEPDDPNPQVNREAPEPGEIDIECEKRLFVPTSDGRLISISAETGEICAGFGGTDGTVNLWANMPNVTPGSAYSTSPPVVTEELIIVGGAVNDNSSTTSPSGVIRAYDLVTGELVWNFDSRNPEATEPIANDETYTQNAPNSWSVSSYDPELGLVYIPMGNQSPDQYGGERGENTERFSSSVLALDAATGEVEWVYQTVHHDIWDMDVPAQPSLIDLTIDGETIPALVQPTKQGDIFVLDRRTGEPIHPVEEVSAPQGAVEGDFTAKTQPVSSVTFMPEPLTGADMWGATPLDQLYCRIAFNQYDYRGRYTPPSENGTIVYPGNFGTFNWGGVAVDPVRQIMFGMPVYLAFTVKMIERPEEPVRIVTEEGEPVFNENFGAPYAVKMGPFTSPLGLPCQQPPWGYIAAVDLVTGETVYKHVNGTVRDLSPIPLPFEMGVPGIGGPIVTGGGLAFLSGTLDYYVRGYDLQTGEEIWRARLPAGGQATPATYLGADGRQYLVVVAGGHGSTGTKAGDAIIAYALPTTESAGEAE